MTRMNSFALAAILCLSVAACGSESDSGDQDAGHGPEVVDGGGQDVDASSGEEEDAAVDPGDASELDRDAGAAEDDAGEGDDAGAFQDAGPSGDAGTPQDAGEPECTQADQYCNENDRNGMRCKDGHWSLWTCNEGKTCSRRDDGWLSCVSTVKEFSFDGLDCTTSDTYTTPNKSKLKRCIVQVGGVEMKVFAPAKWTGGDVTMAVYLHGDGATPYTQNYAPKYQGDWVAAQTDLLYVVARAPNGCAWWRSVTPTYTGCSDGKYATTNPQDVEGKNADALKKAIEGLRAVLPIREDRTLYAGSSGGSIMLTASWIPKYGDRFPGYYVLECGGEEPWGEFSWSEEDIGDYVKDMTFVYGTGERLKGDIMDAYDYYDRDGVSVWEVEREPTSEADHCNYDQLGDVTLQWDNVWKLLQK